MSASPALVVAISALPEAIEADWLEASAFWVAMSALPEAVVHARDYVRGAIAAGADVATGSGNGPLNHGFAPVPMRRLPGAA